MAKRVPFTGGEKESLHTSLDRHRNVILWKLDGLDDADLHRPMAPSGTSLLGLVKHLASVEYGWFCQTFGRETEPLPFDEDDENADLRVQPDEPTDEIVAFYGRARTAADQVIADFDLDDTGTAWWRRGVDAVGAHPHDRYAGHVDIFRELIDGATGDHRGRSESVPVTPLSRRASGGRRATNSLAVGSPVAKLDQDDVHLGRVPPLAQTRQKVNLQSQSSGPSRSLPFLPGRCGPTSFSQ